MGSDLGLPGGQSFLWRWEVISHRGEHPLPPQLPILSSCSPQSEEVGQTLPELPHPILVFLYEHMPLCL